MLVHPAILWFVNTDFGAANGYRAKTSPGDHNVTVAESQRYVFNPTNPGGALDDRVEHRLHVGGRATDDAEHFGGCRLMLQCFAQFCVALLQFLKQPHVLDSDNGLVGEGLKKSYLLLGERADFFSVDRNCSD